MQEVLHGVKLHMPSLFNTDEQEMRLFALVSNFKWDLPARTTPGSKPQCMIGPSKDLSEEPDPKENYDREHSHPTSLSSPIVSRGIFALYPVQPGPAGALFFEPPRHNLKALVPGHDPEFKLTAVMITKDARVDVPALHRWAFPIAQLLDFMNEFFRVGLSSSHPFRWFTDIPLHVFLEEHDSEFPDQVQVIRHEVEGGRPYQEGRGNSKMKTRLDTLQLGAHTYWKCAIDYLPRRYYHEGIDYESGYELQGQHDYKSDECDEPDDNYESDVDVSGLPTTAKAIPPKTKSLTHSALNRTTARQCGPYVTGQ